MRGTLARLRDLFNDLPDASENETVTAPLAAKKRKFRKSPMSSIGRGVDRSATTKTPSRTAKAPNPNSVAGLPQPASGASMIV